MFYARDLLAIDDWKAVYSQPVAGHWTHWHSHTLLDVSCNGPAVALRAWNTLIVLFSLNNTAEEGYC